MMRKFGTGRKDKAGYAAGVRLGNAKSAKWLHRATGGRCEDDLDEVEGGKAQQRLDRPGRKNGGSVKRKHFEWGGEADTGEYLRDKADAYKAKAKSDVNNAAKSGQAAVVGHIIKDLATKKPAKAIGSIMRGAGIGFGAMDAASAAGNAVGAAKAGKLADEAEGRACGGSIKKYAKGGFLKGIKKGALHKEMGVPAGEKIPAKKLDKATHSSSPLLKKRAVLAKTMKSWNHK